MLNIWPNIPWLRWRPELPEEGPPSLRIAPESKLGAWAEMLHAAPSDFFTSVRRSEAALWLKAIYWDTGVVRTPEQTIAKAYDFMPGVERPDFVAT
jgi:hypothetical protein